MLEKGHFDKIANSYELKAQKGLWGYFKRQELSAVQKTIAMIQPQSILDVGAGPGIYAEFLQKTFPEIRITVAEKSPAMLQACQQKGLQGFLYDLENANAEGPQFKLVLGLGILEFIANPLLAARNLYQFTDQGSYLLILVPRYSLLNVLYWVFHRVRKNPLWLRRQSKYQDLFEQVGFRLESSVTATWISRLMLFKKV